MDEKKTYHQHLRKYSSMKVIQILSAISYSESYSTVTEICEITGISIATVHRILQELVACGFVVKDNEQKRYRAGFEAWYFAMRLKHTDYLHEAAKEEMRRLNDLSLETIHLIGIEGEQGVYIDKLGAKNSIGLRSQIGRRIPLYCTGGGKALLAHQTDHWIEGYLKRVSLEKFTNNTIVTKKALMKELEIVRIQGYALDNRENHSDIICIAAPVFDCSGEAICSIGISAPDYRFSLDMAVSYADEVKKSAELISARLKK